MIHVLVTMEIKAGGMEEFLRLCGKLRPLVLAEKGCLAYDYTRDIASPLSIQEPLDANRVTLVEKWESLDALKTHMGTAHMKDSGPAMNALRESVAARVCESVF